MMLNFEIFVIKLLCWFLEPGDPVRNDHRTEIIFILALVLVWLAPVCTILIVVST